MTTAAPHPSKPRTSTTAKPAARAGTKSSSKSTAKPRTKPTVAASKEPPAVPASQLIDQRIRELGGWRGQTLARMRALILEANPQAIEEWKWRGTPVWSHHGILCTGESYAKVVKLTFAHGASLPDPARLFNASLDGNLRRAIDLHEGETVDAAAFKELLRAAGARNDQSGKAKPAPKQSAPVKLLAGGNPQIAKADGDAPVQAYLAALSGWQRDVGRWLDALIVRSVPGVVKAVKWNSPFYGLEGQGWFLSVHTFTRYLKVTFFSGASLQPLPPGASKRQTVRGLDIREADKLDEEQLAQWVKQAAALPGWVP